MKKKRINRKNRSKPQVKKPLSEADQAFYAILDYTQQNSSTNFEELQSAAQTQKENKNE